MSDPNYPKYPTGDEGDVYSAPQNSQDSAPRGQTQSGQTQQAYQGVEYEHGYQQSGQHGYQQPVQQSSQQAQYGQPVWRPTDGFSVAALVTSLLGFNVIAIVLGIVGLNRTKNGAMAGRGMAIAGIVIGSLWFVAILILMIFYFSLVGASYTW